MWRRLPLNRGEGCSGVPCLCWECFQTPRRKQARAAPTPTRPHSPSGPPPGASLTSSCRSGACSPSLLCPCCLPAGWALLGLERWPGREGTQAQGHVPPAAPRSLCHDSLRSQGSQELPGGECGHAPALRFPQGASRAFLSVTFPLTSSLLMPQIL